MVGAEGMETKVEVILGVDTHLDFHVAVAVDHLGRRLDECCQDHAHNSLMRP
jgi:hypothetical protein